MVMHHDWGYRDLTVIVPNLYVFYDPVTDLSEDRRWYICRAVDESSGRDRIHVLILTAKRSTPECLAWLECLP